MNTVIRQYQDCDLQGLMDAWENANQLAHPFLSKEFVAQVRNDIPALYLPNADTWVVEDNNQVVGFMALLGNEIGAIFLQPELHGKKMGKMLMDKAQALHGNLKLEVFKKNTIGRKFYSKYGFQLTEEKVHEPTGEQVLCLKYISTGK